MHHLEALNSAFMRPVYSPRSEMARYSSDVEKNKTNLAINIDKETLVLFKNEYENNDNKIDRVNFVAIGLKILNSWQKDLQYRQSRLATYLLSLFDEIQNKIEGLYVTWQEFNNLIIEKALNLKSLQSHDSESVSQLKQVLWSKGKTKSFTPIQKIVCINRENKLAFLSEESNKIQFLSTVSSQHNFKPLILDRQDLTVQKTLVKRVKNQTNKSVIKQNYKKKVVVSGYTVTFLDMIYVSSQKYDMLITSSSDCIVRGWDVHGTTPTLAKQPENEEEKMVHQFPVEIYAMAWDQINDVLYCSAKDQKIYLWMVKTDSQKQLYDLQNGHHSMISSMIMIPKLQFLATGDYEGKLILWDTISMTKKYKYEQHTRSIVSMTFHQALILLFTAAFDHSICVWNPYIPSLIHKISCNVNVLQVHIIGGTNYLAALDEGSTLKIREINKFNLISSFVVDRPDQNEVVKGEDEREDFSKIEPTCMGVSEDPVRFFFGGNSIKCMEFDQNEALNSSDHFPILLKYHDSRMKLYVVIKNNILIWDMLTGQLYDILQSQADQQITALDLIEGSGRFVVGDVQGSIYIRKLENGIKISRIYKHRQKAPINKLISRRGGIWNEAIIIGCCNDGEIVVFGRDQSNDYGLLRSFNPKKTYPNATITALQYEEKRNLLMLGTSLGDIICMDVDKCRVANHIQAKSLEAIRIFIRPDIPSVLNFGKNGQIFGLYLPPHSKKFKVSCNLFLTPSKNEQKVISVALCKLSNGCYLGYENGLIKHLLLNDHLINNEKISTSQPRNIEPEWQIKFAEAPKDMIIIVNQTILAVILYMKNITLVSTDKGEIINVLPSFGILGKGNFYENPLCYYSNSVIHERNRQRMPDRQRITEKQKEKQKEEIIKQKYQSYTAGKGNSHQLYIPGVKKYCSFMVNTDHQSSKDNQLRIFHDPYFLYEGYLRFMNNNSKSTNTKQGDNKEKNKGKQKGRQIAISKPQNEITKIVWNKEWKIFPQFRQSANKNFQNMLQVQKQANELLVKPKKRLYRNNSVSNTKNVQRAVQAQKKWQKVKQQLEQDNNNKTKSKLLSLSSFKIGGNYSFHGAGQKSQAIDGKGNEEQKGARHQSLHKSQSSPFLRLGRALQKINQFDPKALKLIEMGEKKLELAKNLKLPKINKREQQY